MPNQEEVTQEIEKMQQRVKESGKPEKGEHNIKKIIRMVLMYGALALILAVFIIAFLKR